MYGAFTCKVYVVLEDTGTQEQNRLLLSVGMSVRAVEPQVDRFEQY